MKILVGQSYFRVLDPKELERKMPYPPLGTLYAAAILKELNHQVIFFDSMMSTDPAEFIGKIESEKPDLLLIYDDEFNYLTKMCLSKMRDAAISFIRKAKTKGISAVVYSSDATDFPLPYLKNGTDAIIFGEGESTLKEVINSVSRGTFEEDKISIKGLKFWDGNKVFATPKRKLTDMNLLPDPDYTVVNIEEYRKEWITNHGYFSLNISTTRGCPYKCNWCAKPLYGQTYSSVSPQKASMQFKYLKENFAADHIWITDDIFGLKPNWIKEFNDELKKLNLFLPYKCLTRPDLLLHNNTINYLKESGCRTIWIGAESGSQKILNSMEKGTSADQIYKAAEDVHKAGMEIAFFIQFGYPGEDWKDIKLTRKMILDCLPDDIGISVSYPLPGTKFYERVKADLKEKTNWIDSDDFDPMFSGFYERSFYKFLHRFVHSEYRLKKIIKRKNPAKLPQFFYHLIKMLLFRFKLSQYLKQKRIIPLIEARES
jgi:radical SAM superfamily enzyme YgiQ (UPF0313 family)